MDPRDPDYIEIVIKRLEMLEGPSRMIDGQIAAILGYQKRPGPNGKPLWIVPAGDRSVDIPEYTGNLDAAYELTQMVWPNNICAVSANPARAQFEGQPPHSAATPEIAICLASMALKLKMELGYAPE